MLRTTSGSVTGLMATRDITLKGVAITAGTVLAGAQLAGIRVDHLISRGLLKVVPDALPKRSNKALRHFHVTPGDWKVLND